MRLEGCPAARGNDLPHARPRDTADDAPRIGRGAGRHGAGVDDSHVRRLGRSDDLVSRRAELPRHGLDLALVKPRIRWCRGRSSYYS
ncbi:MAG: hypothetical protein MZV64_59320 [Ignavibacteriales bacterium]|nr:hypothetical protein [Ignavibacteriales bacterium]